MEASERQIAPGELELVRQFLNTHDVEDGIDKIATPGAMRDWLAAHGLDPGHRLGEDDVERAISLRESLRALLLANNGEPLDGQAIPALNAIAARSRMTVRFDAAGRGILAPAGDPADSALGELLAIVFRSMAEGTWSRLKACRSDTCQWAFYDHSKNRSGTWCSMAICGNRAKARAYRSRQAAAT